mgnify:FL=1
MTDRPDSRRRILLVEDEAIVALSEKRTIEKHGFDVVVVHSGGEAVDAALGDASLDLVLMDIDLGPGIDGTEAAERILSEVTLPIVFLTNHTEEEYVTRVRDITNYGYVIKHSGEFVLIESIRMALQLFEAHQEIAAKEARLAHIVDEAPVGLFTARADGTLERVNPEVARILAFYSAADVTDHYRNIGVEVFKNPEQWHHLIQILREEGVVRDLRVEAVRRTGETAYLKLNASSLTEHEDGPVRISGFLVDETSKREIEEDLRNSNWERDSIIQLAQELIVRHDRDGKWTFVNDRACEFFGRPREELIGRDFRDYVHPDDILSTESAGKQMVAEHSSITGLVNRQRTPRGWRTVRWNSAPILDDSGRYLGHQATGRDITEEVQFKEQLQSQNAAQRLLLDTMEAQAWFLVDDATYGLANRAHAEFLGLSIEDIQFKDLSDFLPQDVAQICRSNNAYVFETGRTLHSEERLCDGSGGEHILMISRTPKLNPEGAVEYVVCVGNDVTDQMHKEAQLAEERRRLATIIQATDVGTWEWNAKTGETRFNKRWAAMLGYSLEELSPLSVQTWRNLAHPDDLAQSDRLLEEHFSGRSSIYRCEVRVRHKDGHWIWILDTGSIAEWDDDGTPLWVYGIHQDITERKRAEEELQRSLDSQELLMREMNHRVKNNLSLVSSLISLKDATLGERADLSDIRQQVHTIQTVHEELQQTDDLTQVNLRTYLQDLLETLFTRLTSLPVRIENSVQDLTVSSRTAVPIGLIVNEAATNAIRHGFSSAPDTHTFSVDLRTSNDNCVLVIANSGTPLPETVDVEKPHGLGLQLISALVSQLDGTLKVEREPHPVFTIRFPHSLRD